MEENSPPQPSKSPKPELAVVQITTYMYDPAILAARQVAGTERAGHALLSEAERAARRAEVGRCITYVYSKDGRIISGS